MINTICLFCFHKNSKNAIEIDKHGNNQYLFWCEDCAGYSPKKKEKNMSRERLEDLGRLSEIIEDILEDEVFTEDVIVAPDFETWFCHALPDQKVEFALKAGNALPHLEEKLRKALLIARGEDPLNLT